nr:hypothetical protein [Tanacetum cinerariifolium]
MVSISLEGFLPFILLLVVIIVSVVIDAVILVVVVIDAIVGVVIVVASIGVVVIVDGGVSHIIKLSFVIIGKSPDESFHIFSVFGTMFGHKTANSWNLLTAAVTPSVISCWMIASVIAGVTNHAPNPIFRCGPIWGCYLEAAFDQ